MTALRRPAEAVADPTTFRAGVVVLGAPLVGYFAAVASLCALVLALIAARRPRALFSGVSGPRSGPPGRATTWSPSR